MYNFQDKHIKEKQHDCLCENVATVLRFINV